MAWSSLTDEASDILMFMDFANILRGLRESKTGGEKWLCVWVAYRVVESWSRC